MIRQNVALALATKFAFLVSAVFGAAPLWLAVVADTGATVVVTLNGLRLLRIREQDRDQGIGGRDQGSGIRDQGRRVVPSAASGA